MQPYDKQIWLTFLTGYVLNADAHCILSLLEVHSNEEWVAGCVVININTGYQKLPFINTSYQKLPLGSGDYPDKLLIHQSPSDDLET